MTIVNETKETIEAELKVTLAGFNVDELLQIALLLRENAIKASDLNNNIQMFNNGYELCKTHVKMASMMSINELYKNLGIKDDTNSKT